MIRSTTRWQRTAGALAALALVVGACGGDDDTAADEPGCRRRAGRC